MTDKILIDSYVVEQALEHLTCPVDEPVREAFRAALEQQQVEQEPVAWLFQHEETGLTEFVDVQQVEWGFEKNNPRWQKISPVYTRPQPPRQPLTDDEIKDILKPLTLTVPYRWRDIVNAIERAHGIVGE